MSVTFNVTWDSLVVFVAVCVATYVILRVGAYYYDQPWAQRAFWGVNWEQR